MSVFRYARPWISFSICRTNYDREAIMQNFRNLDVWRYSHALTLHSYRTTAMPNFPKSELFGLVSQIRRAAASIGANIAEGCGRYGNPELARFLQIAMGSASELEYHFLLAKDLEMLAEAEYK